MKKALSVMSVILNNEPISIVPNSLEYEGGEAEVIVENATTGGGRNESVHMEDASTAIGKVKFQMYNTRELDQLIAECKSQTGGNVVQLVERVQNQNVVRTFKGQSLVNKVARKAGSDAKVPFEFEGDQMV